MSPSPSVSSPGSARRRRGRRRRPSRRRRIGAERDLLSSAGRRRRCRRSSSSSCRRSVRSRPGRWRRRVRVLAAVGHAAVVGVGVDRIEVVVAPRRRRRGSTFAAASCRRVEQSLPTSVPSKSPSPSLSASSDVDVPSPSVSSLGFASSPSRTPSSSVSASSGRAEHASSASSARRRRCPGRCVSSARCPSVGSRLAGSITPLRLLSSQPSLAPPSSVSRSTGEVFGAPPSPSTRSAARVGVRRGVAVLAELGAVEQAVVVAVRVEHVDEPVAVGVVVGFGSSPSRSPSSSLSASSGSEPNRLLEPRRSARRRRVSFVWVVAPLPAWVRLAWSTAPSRSWSSAVLAPPLSYRRRAGRSSWRPRRRRAGSGLCDVGVRPAAIEAELGAVEQPVVVAVGVERH